MLDWLINAGANPAAAENQACKDEIDQHLDDAPETPAPIFAVRAFKQAIWGTPQPGETVKRQAQPRRRDAPRNASSSAAKASTAVAARNDHRKTTLQETTPLSSPAKRPGILLTPGTGGKGRKTVSFDAYQRALHTGMTNHVEVKLHSTPKDLPGKFPSPSVPNFASGTTRPTAMGEAITTSRLNDAATMPIISDPELLEGSDDHNDYSNPHSASGRYWKSTHEAYAKKSELQMRKLVKKEQIAKKFAKFKDAEALKLTEQLARERKKVEDLESKLEDYIRRLENAVTISTEEIRENEARHDYNDVGTGDNETSRPIAFHAQQVPQKGVEQNDQNTTPYYRPDISTNRPLLLTMRDSPELKQSLKSGPTMKNLPEYISSDIWANIDDPGFGVKSPASTHQLTGHHLERLNWPTSGLRKEIVRMERKPLGPTTGNAANTKLLRETEPECIPVDPVSAKEEVKDKIRADMMSKERREAAKKRLEERKRAKDKGKS